MYKLASHETECISKFPLCTFLVNPLPSSKEAFDFYSHILARPSYWWNFTVPTLLCLSSFTQNAFEIHLCCNIYQVCISLSSSLLKDYITIYLPIFLLMSILFLFGILNKLVTNSECKTILSFPLRECEIWTILRNFLFIIKDWV